MTVTLVDRVRAALAEETDVREVRMFGGLSFMVRGAMLVAVRDEGLLARVDPEHGDELAARPGASRAEMGTGRDMGPGWIHVTAEALDGDELTFWLDAARAHHATLS